MRNPCDVVTLKITFHTVLFHVHLDVVPQQVVLGGNNTNKFVHFHVHVGVEKQQVALNWNNTNKSVGTCLYRVLPLMLDALFK